MKLKASLPKEDLNGLQAIHGRLIKFRGRKFLVIGAVTSHEYTDVEGKGKEAKVELVRLEVVPEGLETYIAELIERATEDRTGQTALDMDIEGATDLRREFKPKQKRPESTPDLFTEPQAIEAAPALAGDDVVDAEVIDEADENAVEDAQVEEEERIPFDQWVQQQAGPSLDEPDDDDSPDPATPSFSDRPSLDG